MEFLFFLFVLFIVFNVVRGFVAEAKKQVQAPPSAQAPWRLEGEGHLYRLGVGAPAAPARAPSPDPWWEVVDADALPQIDVARLPEPVSVAVYDDAAGGLSVAPRPLPPVPVALDVEVDRDAEHARLHARIDRPVRTAPNRAAHEPRLPAFRDREALRRAVLAAEVLGPPRALAEGDR